MKKNMLVFISASVVMLILAVAFFLMFGKSSIDPRLSDNSELTQEENVGNFDFQGGVTAPITN